MRYVMTYRAVEDPLPLARQHGPAHVTRLLASAPHPPG
jgi:uncharacterized protein